MISEDIVDRYCDILRTWFSQESPPALEAARQLGRELYTHTVAAEELLLIHLKAMEKLREAGHRSPFGAFEAASLAPAQEMLSGWTEEHRPALLQLRNAVETLRSELELSRAIGAHRASQLMRCNRSFVSEAERRRRAEVRMRRLKHCLLTAHRVSRIGFWEWHLPDGAFRCKGLSHLLRKVGPAPMKVTRLADFLALIHPEDRDRVEEWFGLVQQGFSPPQIEFRFVSEEVIFVQQDVALRGKRGEGIKRANGFFVDITRVKLAEAAIRRSERGVALGVFAAGLAHEINNPLGAALLSAETALKLFDRSESPPLLGECLRNVVSAIERCGAIVREILAFSRQQPGKKELVDLRELVERSIRAVQIFLERRQASLHVQLHSGPLTVVASPLEIEVALVNLLRNAIESRQSDTHVSVTLTTQGKFAVLTIRDNGRGMTAYEVEHMFDPFYTTRISEAGTGLGAAIAHAIIQDHDGRIDVRSQVGYGTTVEVYLPLTEWSQESPRSQGEGN